MPHPAGVAGCLRGWFRRSVLTVQPPRGVSSVARPPAPGRLAFLHTPLPLMRLRKATTDAVSGSSRHAADFTLRFRIARSRAALRAAHCRHSRPKYKSPAEAGPNALHPFNNPVSSRPLERLQNSQNRCGALATAKKALTDDPLVYQRAAIHNASTLLNCFLLPSPAGVLLRPGRK